MSDQPHQRRQACRDGALLLAALPTARTVSEALAAAETPQDRQKVIEAALIRYAGRLPMPGV